ncbi:MAG: DEAD/DEAH box helicase [Gammaproteobacteria bacterium]|nr:MAG: DEAD/DEAH box helicase [Gammaproteobacteria bacterium]
MTFERLGLSADLLRALSDQGYTEPTPIQSKAIPVILEGKDILAGAQTGTGKTAGFTLPLLQRLSDAGPAKHIRALILTPTRELAAQVGESVETYGRYLDLRSTVIFGGVKINPQIAALRKGADILVATPGRLLDHVGQGNIDLSGIEVLVLDEADRMLDMGFIHDIRKVLALLPERRQNLLFSATFSAEIRELADRLLDDPVSVDVAPRNTAAETVAQKVYRVDRERKNELLAWLIGHNDWRQVLVFTRTKHGTNRLAQYLEKAGISAAAIHGNKSQGARTRALAGFKRGDVRVLVATDIAARGLDIDQLPHVVNFELPNVAEDYVHRIGRTGRAGCEGEAISLVCVDEERLLRDIEKLLGRSLPSEVVSGFEPDPSIKPEPIQGRGRRDAGKGRPGGRNGPRNGKRRARRAASGRDSGKPAKAVQKSKPLPRDDNGDVNGNTLFTDNSNRDPVMLAGGYEIARRKKRAAGKRKPGSQAKNTNGKRRSGNGARRRSSTGIR